MMNETICKIQEKKDKIKERISNLDDIFNLAINSSDNNKIKKKKKIN
tara:strand:+ start:3464 stop:3604 length:141 start_codon:yes stop_codon:yes gene_type:complete